MLKIGTLKVRIAAVTFRIIQYYLCTFVFNSKESFHRLYLVGEFQIYPGKKSDLNPIFFIYSPFLRPSFFRREEKKGKI